MLRPPLAYVSLVCGVSQGLHSSRTLESVRYFLPKIWIWMSFLVTGSLLPVADPTHCLIPVLFVVIYQPTPWRQWVSCYWRFTSLWPHVWKFSQMLLLLWPRSCLMWTKQPAGCPKVGQPSIQCWSLRRMPHLKTSKSPTGSDFSPILNPEPHPLKLFSFCLAFWPIFKSSSLHFRATWGNRPLHCGMGRNLDLGYLPPFFLPHLMHSFFAI